MGLDFVELIMAVEKRFNIRIEDTEAEQAVTVGGLYQLILEKKGLPGPKVCGSSRAFWALRRAAVDVSRAARKAIRPDTKLEDLFPEGVRRERWQEYQEVTGLRFPALRRRRWPPEELVFPKQLPNGLETLGDLAIASADSHHWEPDAIWDELVTVVVEETGVERDEVHPNASFVDDLGMD